MMIERGGGDICQQAYRSSREMCGAFPLKDFEGRSHKSFARIHPATIASLYEMSIALL
jgi:hypothetical protein